MSVEGTDFTLYKATYNTDTTANGGAISTNAITSGVLNNLFPNTSDAERTAGLTRYRKLFARNLNSENLDALSMKAWISTMSLAADYYRLKAGTNTDTQNVSAAYTEWAGSGILNATVIATATEIEVAYDVTADGVYDGSTILLDNGAGIQEEAVVSGAPVWGGTIATITLSAPLSNGFSLTTTKVGTLIDLSTIAPSYDSFTVTSSAGTYDDTTYPVELYNIGTTIDSFTLTFTNATSFSVTASVATGLAAGAISSDYKPTHEASYYFNIDSDGFGGTFVAGDTITFNTVHAGKSVWVKQVVPALTASYSNNTVVFSLKGASE